MTRSGGQGAPRSARPSRPVRDPYGLLPAGTPIAAVVSVIGLLVVAFVTLSLGNGRLPVNVGGNGPNASDGGGVAHTPTPSNVVVVPDDPRADVPGTIVYAKDGNIWIQSGLKATQLTTAGTDSMPSFSPDGQSIYFVRTRHMSGLWPVNGVPRGYSMDVPSVMRVPVAGGDPTLIYDGLFNPPGKYVWSGFIREPVVSPDGTTIALVTDMPNPTVSDVVLKLLDLRTRKITDPKLSEQIPLGHQDPAWRPDGKLVLYVRNDRDGAKGTSRIYAYNPATKRSTPVTGPGYLHPSWSPDGRYIAATKTSAFGTDVVILDASNGAEVLRLTDDGNSWAPAWSPAGDAIVFLHVSGQVVDLRLVQLAGSAPSWTPKDPLDLTTNAGLDAVSRPDWYIPPDQLPATPAPTVAPASPSPSGQ